MGKMSVLVTTLFCIGLIGVLVYFCSRVKRKRNLAAAAGNGRFSDVFSRQDPGVDGQTVCPPGQAPTLYPGPHAGYSYHHHMDPNYQVPHTIVNPNASFAVNPYVQYPPGNVNPPYPIGNPNMSMPGVNFQLQQQPIYPFAGPPQGSMDDLPPPYSAVVGPNAPKY